MSGYNLRTRNNEAIYMKCKADRAESPASESDLPLLPKRQCNRTSSDLAAASQSVHVPFLSFDDMQNEDLGLSEKTVQLGVSLRSTDYCDWWQTNQADVHFFGIRLIGRANKRDTYTAMACSDLGFARSVLVQSFCTTTVVTKLTHWPTPGCSKWGHNRIHDHPASRQPLELVTPVCTEPEVLQQAVASLLSGEIKLSGRNIEPLLVLANAVGVRAAQPVSAMYLPSITILTTLLLQFETLEAACLKYLCSRLESTLAHTMTVLQLGKLGDHLGLSRLCEAAANHIIRLPWHYLTTRSFVKQVLEIPFFANSNARSHSLLHHPSRGAVCELHLLDLLQGAGIDEANIASLVDVQYMSDGELRTLLGIPATEEYKSRPTTLDLLYKAAEHLETFKPVQPTTEPHGRTWVTQTNLQTTAGLESFPIPRTDLFLDSRCQVIEGKHRCKAIEPSVPSSCCLEQ